MDLSSETLNSACFCVSLDESALQQALTRELGDDALADMLRAHCPHVFAARPVFVSPANLARMQRVVQAVEAVVALPAWRERVLAHAPGIARHNPRGAQGVFFGYDFHVTEGGFGLIEINTNAGGAMLNAVLAQAQRACCAEVEALVPPPAEALALEARMVEMFRAEWAAAGTGRPLRSIAIVDEDPRQQYLYPEFLLFRRLFERAGLQAVVAAPEDLRLHGGRLWVDDLAIDLVYNRLTDFALEAPASATLRAAYLQDAVLLTPHPQAHALYADKRNLALLGDSAALQAMGVPDEVQAMLRDGVPHAEVVNPAHAERLWQARKQLFFKPFAGYGGKAAWRGDKITRGVWQEVLAGGYIAQALVRPGERTVRPTDASGPAQVMKYDLRLYTWQGRPLWTAARLYQGQTTNFRTPGGGFAPVFAGF